MCRCVSISLFRCASRSIASENYDGNAIIRIKIPWFAQMKICSLAPGFGWVERDWNSWVCIKSDIAHFHPNCVWCLRVTHKATNMADNRRFVWTEEEVVAFLTLIKEKQITAILDSKQQRNSSIYQELWVGTPVKRLSCQPVENSWVSSFHHSPYFWWKHTYNISHSIKQFLYKWS